MNEDRLQQLIERGEINEFLVQCNLDFSKFFREVLGYDWGNHLAKIHSLADKHRRSAFMAPRGHGKTTLMISKIAHQVLFNRGRRILILANSLEQAKKNLRELKSLISENVLLKQLMPDDKDMAWSATRIELKTGCYVEAKANNANVRGGHYDLVFCDEVGQYEDKENFYQVVLPTINARKGKIICIGTPQSKIDLLSELFAPGSSFVCRKYIALTDGKPLWPERFGLKELDDIKRSMPPLSWQQEYLCDPIGDETGLFPWDLIEPCLDQEGEFVVKPDFRHQYIMAVDYASSPKKDADATVWMVGRDEGNGTMRLVYMFRARGWVFQRQYDFTKEIYQRYRPRRFVLDNGHVGVVFAQKLKEEGFRVEPVNFKSAAGSMNKRMDMLTKLRQLFEQKNLVIPRAMKHDTRKMTDILIQELMDMGVNYTEKTQKVTWKTVGKHDDAVMSCAMLAEAFGAGVGQWSIEFFEWD
jgi:hypothetical protein